MDEIAEYWEEETVGKRVAVEFGLVGIAEEEAIVNFPAFGSMACNTALGWDFTFFYLCCQKLIAKSSLESTSYF